MSELAAENVENYSRPQALEPVQHRLRLLNGEIDAETTCALRVLETHHAPTCYIPPEDVMAELIPVHSTTFCEGKGQVPYFDVQNGGTIAARAVWSSPSPNASFKALAGRGASYAAAMDACFVGEERVIPQLGDFHGGWVTANLHGCTKGARGTEHW